MFPFWWRKLLQRIYCAQHVGVCDECQAWKAAKAERRRKGVSDA